MQLVDRFVETILYTGGDEFLQGVASHACEEAEEQGESE